MVVLLRNSLKEYITSEIATYLCMFSYLDYHNELFPGQSLELMCNICCSAGMQSLEGSDKHVCFIRELYFDRGFI